MDYVDVETRGHGWRFLLAGDCFDDVLPYFVGEGFTVCFAGPAVFERLGIEILNFFCTSGPSSLHLTENNVALLLGGIEIFLSAAFDESLDRVIRLVLARTLDGVVTLGPFGWTLRFQIPKHAVIPSIGEDVYS